MCILTFSVVSSVSEMINLVRSMTVDGALLEQFVTSVHQQSFNDPKVLFEGNFMNPVKYGVWLHGVQDGAKQCMFNYVAIKQQHLLGDVKQRLKPIEVC